MDFAPISESQVGGYVAEFRAFLEDYESVSGSHKPASTIFEMSLIVDTAINDPPYFDPPLDDSFPV